MAKFVNDSPARFANCVMKRLKFDGKLHIFLKAIANIVDGEELRYDYGDSGLLWRSHVSFNFD